MHVVIVAAKVVILILERAVAKLLVGKIVIRGDEAVATRRTACAHVIVLGLIVIVAHRYRLGRGGTAVLGGTAHRAVMRAIIVLIVVVIRRYARIAVFPALPAFAMRALVFALGLQLVVVKIVIRFVIRGLLLIRLIAVVAYLIFRARRFRLP